MDHTMIELSDEALANVMGGDGDGGGQGGCNNGGWGNGGSGDGTGWGSGGNCGNQGRYGGPLSLEGLSGLTNVLGGLGLPLGL